MEKRTQFQIIHNIQSSLNPSSETKGYLSSFKQVFQVTAAQGLVMAMVISEK